MYVVSVHDYSGKEHKRFKPPMDIDLSPDSTSQSHLEFDHSPGTAAVPSLVAGVQDTLESDHESEHSSKTALPRYVMFNS